MRRLLVVSSKGKFINAQDPSMLNILSKTELLLGNAQDELYDVAVVRKTSISKILLKQIIFERSLYFSKNWINLACKRPVNCEENGLYLACILANSACK